MYFHWFLPMVEKEDGGVNVSLAGLGYVAMLTLMVIDIVMGRVLD